MILEVYYCHLFEKIVAVTKRDIRVFNITDGH